MLIPNICRIFAPDMLIALLSILWPPLFSALLSPLLSPTKITMDSLVQAGQVYTYDNIQITEEKRGNYSSFIEREYTERQRLELAEKSRYIQSQLQNMYTWTYELTDNLQRGLTVDLQDLQMTYGVAAIVYDLDGMEIAKCAIQEEADIRTTLTAYMEFLNGADMRIGFIAIPFYITEEEIRHQNGLYIRNILPPMLILMLLMLIVGFFGGRHLLQMQQRKARKQYEARVGAMKEEAARLARSERELAWRTMARQVAHEINNPLTPMKLTIQHLERLRGTERFDEAFDQAAPMLVEEIDNLSHIATAFSTFAKTPEVRVAEVPIADKLTAAIDLLRHNEEGIPIRYVGPDKGVMVMADGEQIGQVFVNILRNAVQALSETQDGDIIVILKEQTGTNEVEISISDNGPGIPAEIQDKVFMPNFTTKSSGSGLGLAISKNIVEGSGGRITFMTGPKGTTFYIYMQDVR